MKKTLLLTAILCAPFAYGSGVPTVDLGTITQLQAEAKIQADRWTATLEQYKNELKTQMDTLASQTGITNIKDFMNDTSSYFEDSKELASWISNPQKILDNGFDSLSSELKDIYKSYGLDNYCSSYEGSEAKIDVKQRKACEGEIVLMTLRQKQNENTLKDIDGRVEKIQGISKTMATAKTQKESTDLNNAMNTQIALLQADKLKMDLQVQQEKQQEDLIRKQKSNNLKERLESERQPNAQWK